MKLSDYRPKVSDVFYWNTESRDSDLIFESYLAIEAYSIDNYNFRSVDMRGNSVAEDSAITSLAAYYFDTLDKLESYIVKLLNEIPPMHLPNGDYINEDDCRIISYKGHPEMSKGHVFTVPYYHHSTIEYNSKTDKYGFLLPYFGDIEHIILH